MHHDHHAHHHHGKDQLTRTQSGTVRSKSIPHQKHHMYRSYSDPGSGAAQVRLHRSQSTMVQGDVHDDEVLSELQVVTDESFGGWHGATDQDLHMELAHEDSHYELAAKIFDQLDADGSGEVDINELAAAGRVMEGTGRDWSVRKTASRLRRIDRDGDGMVSKSEFVAHYGDDEAKERRVEDRQIRRIQNQRCVRHIGRIMRKWTEQSIARCIARWTRALAQNLKDVARLEPMAKHGPQPLSLSSRKPTGLDDPLPQQGLARLTRKPTGLQPEQGAPAARQPSPHRSRGDRQTSAARSPLPFIEEGPSSSIEEQSSVGQRRSDELANNGSGSAPLQRSSSTFSSRAAVEEHPAASSSRAAVEEHSAAASKAAVEERPGATSSSRAGRSAVQPPQSKGQAGRAVRPGLMANLSEVEAVWAKRDRQEAETARDEQEKDYVMVMAIKSHLRWSQAPQHVMERFQSVTDEIDRVDAEIIELQLRRRDLISEAAGFKST